MTGEKSQNSRSALQPDKPSLFGIQTGPPIMLVLISLVEDPRHHH